MPPTPPPNVCPPDNDPPPCANTVEVRMMSQQSNLAVTIPETWTKKYSSPKKADVYLKLGQGKSIKIIKYDRGRKNKSGNYIYSIPKKAISVLNKYSGLIEVMKIFIDAKRKINNFKSMHIRVQ